MTYMLDTNMCVYAQKDVRSVSEALLSKEKNELAISSITLAELRYGVENSNRRAESERHLADFLKMVNVLNFDEKAAVEYGKIRLYLRKNGITIGGMDMLIATHAKSENLIVVTNNVREFERVPDLKSENWYNE